MDRSSRSASSDDIHLSPIRLSRSASGVFDYELNKPTRHLTTLPLACLIFYSVSGGPFGMESSVKEAGALYTLIGFTVFPIFWSIPEALMTAELATAYPEASGCVAWVHEAFGPTAGLVNGYLTWLSGVTDNSLYPVLFLQYLLADSPYLSSRFTPGSLERWGLVSAVVLFLSALNYRGLKFVGNVNVVIAIVSVAPFVILSAACIPKIDPSRWLVRPDTPVTDIDWGEFMNILFWNLNYFDAAASFSGEVVDPGKTYPRASFWAVLMVAFGYLIPLLATIGASSAPDSDWDNGYSEVVASHVVGRWLSAWILFGSGIANLALFQAEMSSDSFQLLGMAERGLVPSVFARRSRFGTPTAAICVSAVICVALASFEFSSLVEMVNFLYVFSLFMEFAAFIKLRMGKGASVHRPFMIPLSTAGCCLMLTPATGFLLVMMALASWQTWVVCFGMIAGGGLVAVGVKGTKEARWCDYEGEGGEGEEQRLRWRSEGK